jgi:hypothetical protein
VEPFVEDNEATGALSQAGWQHNNNSGNRPTDWAVLQEQACIAQLHLAGLPSSADITHLQKSLNERVHPGYGQVYRSDLGASS